jgi:hypothetical protein
MRNDDHGDKSDLRKSVLNRHILLGGTTIGRRHFSLCV